MTTLPIQMMIYGEYYFDPSIAALSVMILLLTMSLVYLDGTDHWFNLLHGITLD